MLGAVRRTEFGVYRLYIYIYRERERESSTKSLWGTTFFLETEWVCTGLFHPLQAVFSRLMKISPKRCLISRRFASKPRRWEVHINHNGVKKEHTTWTWNLNFLQEPSLEVVASWPAEWNWICSNNVCFDLVMSCFSLHSSTDLPIPQEILLVFTWFLPVYRCLLSLSRK